MQQTWSDPGTGAGSLPPEPVENGRMTAGSVESGQILAGRYRLGRILHEYPGTVSWQAYDDALSRPVVAHVLDPGFASSSAVMVAARRAAAATDSRFLRVLDAMGENTPPFIICESVIGITLAELLARGPLTALEAAHIVREIADALAPMHTQGVFHRLLNPRTITITRNGNVKISGFLMDAALRSPATKPPPPWRDQEATDVRAMGKLLYACLVARWPIEIDLEQTRQWGLLAAPLTAPTTSGTRRWVSPAALSPRVPLPLNDICMQILTPRVLNPRVPNSRGDPDTLPTAEEIDQALGRVLGNAAADDQLQHRVIQLLGSRNDTPRSELDTVIPGLTGLSPSPPHVNSAASESDIATRTMPAVDGSTTGTVRGTAAPDGRESGSWRQVARPVRPAQPGPDQARHEDSGIGRAAGGQSSPGQHADGIARLGSPAVQADNSPSTIGPSGTILDTSATARPTSIWDERSRAYRLGRWLIPLFVVLMVIVSVTGMLHSCSAQAQEGHSAGGAVAAGAAPTPDR